MSKRASNAAAVIDFATFVEGTLVDPITQDLFVLTEAEKTFARHAFKLGPDGRLKYSELLYSAPMKTGKTTLGAMMGLYVIYVLAGRLGEVICVANDLEQAQGRVFQMIKNIIEASPMLASDAIVTTDKVTFRSTGSVITAIASDYASAAGANPNLVIFDELWAFTSERSRRLWDELPPPPTRQIAARLIVTYAGFEGESVLLEGLYKRGMAQPKVAADLRAGRGLLMYWTHKHTAPWQTREWVEQMRESERPNAFLRRIENRWVSNDSNFIDMALWDACVDPQATPLIADPSLSVWAGLDGSYKHDSTAIVACTLQQPKTVRMVWHRTFTPTARAQIDFEVIEEALLDLKRRFRLKEVRYDPYQLAAVAQRLLKAGVPMVEYPQSPANITQASTCLYDLIAGKNLTTYPDKAFRLAVQRAVAKEIPPRGWKITKDKSSHKIDCVVALAMAAFGAVEGGIARPPLHISSELLAAAARPTAYSRAHARTHLMGTRVAGGTYSTGKMKAFF